MFKVYYTVDHKNYKLIFAAEELCDCVNHVKSCGVIPQKCVIVAPNNRKITFTDDNDLNFGSAA